MTAPDRNVPPRSADRTERGLQHQEVLLAHGGGGQLTDQLLRSVILPPLANPMLNELFDSAVLDSMDGCRPALTLDSYVVQPWQFPGADIGRLAIAGTVNDLAVCGARPLGIALGLILSEGFPTSSLQTVMSSIASTADEAGVRVVTGDTKVVGRDQGDGVFITTAGVGAVKDAGSFDPRRVQPGDAILINGPIADHGLAVMLAREMPDVESVLRSDAAPLNHLIQSVLAEIGDGVVFMRDATRGGLAGVADDLAQAAGRRVTLWEEAIPVRPSTRHAADMLGLDPLDVANEGKVVMVVRADVRERAIAALQAHDLGREAIQIGQVEQDQDGRCQLLTEIGGRRIVQKPYGEQLPRIC